MMPTSPSPSLKFSYGGFSPIRLQGQPIRHRLPLQRAGKAHARHTRRTAAFACALRGCRPPQPSGSESRFAGASTRRCARGHPSLPQGSLAPGRVLLSPPLIAYYDPIRQSRRHATTSRHSRLYAAPSLCGHASATHETFPTFHCCAVRTCHRPYAGGSAQPLPLPCGTRYQASSSCDRVATHDDRLCQQYLTGSPISALHRSLYATARAFASPS